MYDRVFNFYAGPATLPLEVLKQVRDELLNWNGEGMSVMEMSHRSKAYDSIIRTAEADLRDLLNIPDDYYVLFLQGGARLQFGMIPLNILPDGKEAAYLITGNWARHAYKEVLRIGKAAHIIASSEDDGFSIIPPEDKWDIPEDAYYIHYTSNNTVYGTQFRELPDFGDRLVVCDMSSDFLSRPVDVSKFGVIYAGAQKNAGPAGVTVVIIRKDLADNPVSNTLPTILTYKDIAAKGSMLNTPPTFSIYVMGLVFKWIKRIGGLKKMAEINEKKAGLLYDAIDNSDGFYKGFVRNKGDRSYMNVTFRLPSPELDAELIKEAESKKLIGIKGYRTVGGVRASIYNAHPIEGVERLVSLMNEFRERHQSNTASAG